MCRTVTVCISRLITQELGAMQQQTAMETYEDPSLEDLRAERVWPSKWHDVTIVVVSRARASFVWS